MRKYFLFLLLSVIGQCFCYAQTEVRTEHLASRINGTITTSITNPLRVYPAGKTLVALNYSEYIGGTFYLPSYYQNTDVPRDQFYIYYNRTGSGPTVKLYKYQDAKVYQRYWKTGGGLGSDHRWGREVYLQFGTTINGSQNFSTDVTLAPAQGSQYDCQILYKFVTTLKHRRSGGINDIGFSEDPSNFGGFVEERNESGIAQGDAFKVISQEAKWTNIDESLMLLQLCNEGQAINLYDYFTDKSGVIFSIDGNPLPDQFLNIASLNKGNYTLTATKQYANGTFTENITLKVVDSPNPIVSISNPTFCEGTTSTLTAPEAPEGEVYTYQWSNGATSRSITVSQSFSGTVTISNGSCSKTSQTVSATLLTAPKPVIQNQTNNNNICDGESAVLVTNQVAQTYNWINQDNQIVGYQQVYTATTAGTYKVVTFYDNGCQNTSDPITITVSPNPAPTITVTGETTFCEGGSVTLTAQLPNNQIAQQYEWSNGQIGQTITVTTAGIYTVTARNVNGCSRISEPLEIKTLPNPQPLITANGALSFCEGGNVKLTVTNAQGATEIVWSTGETGNSITVSETGNYYVTVKRGTCENTSEPIDVVVYPNVTPVIAALGSTEICQGETVTLQVTNPQPNTTYSWSNGQEGLQTVVTETGNYYLIANNTTCYSNSSPISVTVTPIQKPTISLSGAPEFCEGGSITLTVTNPSGADEIRWSTGEIGNSITVSQSGNYYAVLKKGSCERISDEVTINVTPNVKPTIEVLGTSSTICEGETLTLQVTNPQPNTTYTWSNGEQGVQTTVDKGGNYFVNAQNLQNCSRISEPIKVTVNPIAKPTVSLDNETTICQGDSIVMSINENAESYRWSNGATTKEITVKNSGTYTAYIRNGECERASDPIIITVKPNNKIAISQMGTLEFCEGDSLLLTVINNGTYLWNTGETTRTINIKKSGSYSVMVTNEYGCISNSDFFNVTVRPIPKPTINVTGQTTICEGDSTLLTINQTATSYRWSNGATTKSITVKSSGTYTAYTSNEYGCERESDPIAITVNPNPIPQINISGPTEFCETDSVILYVTPIAGMSYKWSNGVEGNSITVKNSGNFYVTSTTPDNCVAISRTVNITVHPLPKPTVHISGNTTFCEGDSILLTINENATSYRWSNGATTKAINVKIGATYTAYITNDYGCERASDPIVVTVHPNSKPTITYTSLVACDGDSIKLTASNAVSYLWSNGATTKEIWVKNPSDYYVTVTNGYGCTNTSDTLRVNILPNDVPTISSSNGSEFCNVESTTLTASEAVLYRWSTGETTRSIVVNKAGRYTVTVINANDCERTSLPFNITVNYPTELNAIQDQSICLNDSDLLLDSINTNPLGGTYAGNGVSLNKFNPETAGAGTHIITYTYRNAKGCISETSFKIEVIPLVELPIGNNLTVCVNDNNVLLINDALPVGTEITGTGVRGSEFVPREAGVGSHIITYTYINKSTCTSTATRIITVNAIPTDPVITGNSTTCSNSTLTLTAKSTVITNKQIFYRWYKENDVEPFDEGATIRYVVNGSEKLYCEAYTDDCASERTEISVFSLTPNIRFSPSATNVLQGTPITFTLEDIPNSNPSIKWEWDFGDGFTSELKSPKHYFNKSGTYTIRVRAFSAEGCMIELEEKEYIIVNEDPIGEGQPVDPNEPIVDENPYLNTVVYPNPIRDGLAKVRVNNPATNMVKGTLQIFTISGRLLHAQDLTLQSGQNDIDINNLHTLVANTYYLFVVRIEGEKDFKTIKVLVL